ncbi:MAG TPA: ROK family protein [Baekduia sp.]|uniref:ROK family protein n=1 Tax=Baekduia sp. TaxID=2600305 RepID=UPI002CFBEF1B|nr:ROK family protein [Baekduia sp.]HMJ33693.1 ROK family protein [Baekduia sp.]
MTPNSSSPDFVVALDFGGTKLDVATATLDGRLIASERLQTDADGGAHQAVERALECARSLGDAATAATGGRLVAAAASSPGIVLDDRILLAPNVPGWTELPLAARLREGLDLATVVTETDVKAAALAESRWGALRGADPGVFLSLGTGIAAGIVVGGRVLHGANGAAGEIGYALRGVHDDAGAANGRAPLEEYAGGRAIGERGSRLLGRPVSAADLFTRAETDLDARMLVDETLAELAVHVANLAVLVDPARIAVGGGLMNSSTLILAALRRRVRQAVPFPPEVVAAQFVHDAPLRGAIALAIDASRHAGVPAPAAIAPEATA